MADSAWIEAIQEELYQFDRLDVWELVDRPLWKNVINMKWLWKKKTEEENTVLLNKAHLHGMTSCDRIGTPMATKPLDADLSGTPVDQTKYRSMVGALMYLKASRPDIVHVTCYCARYQAIPTENTSGRLNGSFSTLKIPLIWDSGGDKLVSWSSKKQDCTSMSLAEVEYVSLSACCAQVLWLRTQCHTPK
ncbi:hypothetical protein Tco_0550712 [Tanacetum coccineum]